MVNELNNRALEFYKNKLLKVITNDLTNELKTKIEGSAQISSEVSLPAATAADKGKIVIVTDSSSNTDKVYICVLNNGTYVYKETTLV